MRTMKRADIEINRGEMVEDVEWYFDSERKAGDELRTIYDSLAPPAWMFMVFDDMDDDFAGFLSELGQALAGDIDDSWVSTIERMAVEQIEYASAGQIIGYSAARDAWLERP